MKITVESTTELAHANGLPVRVWTGATEGGTPILALITRIGVPEGVDADELERELAEPPMRVIEPGADYVASPRNCTVCLANDVRRPATHVARAASGFEWFECGQHGPGDNLAYQPRVALEPIADWFDRVEQRLAAELPRGVYRGPASKREPWASMLAKGKREAESSWLVKDFWVLYRAALDVSESIVDPANETPPQRILRGQLERLRPAFEACEAERRGEPAPPAPRALTEAERTALTALHSWLHRPSGDCELIEAAAEFHNQVESESPAECRRLEAEEKAWREAEATARAAAERANESARTLFDRVGAALGIGMPTPPAEHEGCPPDAPPASPIAGRIIRAIVLDERAVDAATDEPSKLFMAHALRGAQMGWHARVKHPTEVDRVAELGAPKDEPTRSAWLFGFGVAARMADPAAESTPAAPAVVVAGVCRGCGCADEDCSGCIAKTGGPCHWVEPDLCSACVDGERPTRDVVIIDPKDPAPLWEQAERPAQRMPASQIPAHVLERLDSAVPLVLTEAMREYYRNELPYRAPETLNEHERRIIAAVEAEEKAQRGGVTP